MPDAYSTIFDSSQSDRWYAVDCPTCKVRAGYSCERDGLPIEAHDARKLAAIDKNRDAGADRDKNMAARESWCTSSQRCRRKKHDGAC